jgi:hypothetical protein
MSRNWRMPACPARWRTARPRERPVCAHRHRGIWPAGQELPGRFLVRGEVVRPAEEVIVNAGDARPVSRLSGRDTGHRHLPAGRVDEAATWCASAAGRQSADARKAAQRPPASASGDTGGCHVVTSSGRGSRRARVWLGSHSARASTGRSLPARGVCGSRQRGGRESHLPDTGSEAGTASGDAVSRRIVVAATP